MRCLVLGAWCLVLCAFAEEPVPTRVSVASEPAGATVLVDGEVRGTTPTTLFGLKPGRHHLKCRLTGYEESDRIFDTDGGPFLEFVETLVEERGILLLKTEPEGCDIQVDGVSVGRTPRLITHLSTKDTYAVRLRKEGYQDQTISVRFDGRRPLVREEKLVLDSGTIDISSEPAGAAVTVNGVEKGRTPLTVDKVPKGRAVVKFHLDGFADEVRELAVGAGSRQALPIVLAGLPGTMYVSSVPAGARVYVNGEPQGKAPQTLSGLKPGDYEVRVELEGYSTESKKLTVGRGAAVREEFKLSNVMGRLEVCTSPVGAQVFVDGRLVGVTKSKDPNAEYSDILAVEDLSEGEHVLLMKKEGYADLSRTPKIQSRKTSKYHRQRLARIFTPDVEIVTARTTCKGVLLAIKPDYVEIETNPGVVRTFPRDEVRKVNYLKSETSEK